MNASVNLIATDIVGSKYDVFWNSVDETTGGLTPKPVLIITDGADSSNAQLQKMIAACKLTNDQYNILPLEGKNVAWHRVRDILQPKFIFLIGVLPSTLGVSALFRLNEPNRFNDCIWLPTLSLSDLEQNDQLKKQLWVSGMKPIFVDKNFGEII